MSTPSVTILSGVTLTGSFTPSRLVTIGGEKLQLDFLIVTSGGPTTIEWYIETSEDTVNFFRECAEEDAGGGVVLMPKVVRTFADNNGTALADGTHGFSVPFKRIGPMARVQMRVTAGAAIVTLISPTVTLAT